MMLAALGLLLVLSLGLSVLLTATVRALGRRRGLLDTPGSEGHAKRLRRVPNIGGIAVFCSIALPMLGALAAVHFGLLRQMAELESLRGLAEHLPGLIEQTGLAVALLLGALAVHIVGLIDDRRPLGPGVKLTVTVIVALMIVIPFDVRLLELLDAYAGGRWLSIVLTVLWIIVVTNAMNFMDNMDGLAAGVAAVAGSFFLAAAVLNGQWFVGATLSLLVGSVLGFLVFNAPRQGGATIFMGDGGSLVIGFILAVLTVRTTYYTTGSGAWYALFMPVCVLAVPLYDFVTVTLIRVVHGRSPFVGDQRHFSHRLRDRGLSTTRTVLVVCGLTGLTGIGGVLLGQVGPWQAALIGIQTVLALGVLALYELADRPGARVGEPP